MRHEGHEAHEEKHLRVKAPGRLNRPSAAKQEKVEMASNSKGSGIAPLEIIKRYYDPRSRAFASLVPHCTRVMEKALAVARAVFAMNPDMRFIEEAALLHDIGIFKVHAPDIGCTGDAPYVCHGVLGREILEKEGLPRHALVCERHVGAGITAEEVVAAGLPLPVRDMCPVSLEETVVAYADKFFSKNPSAGNREKPVDEIVREMAKYGPRQKETFLSWVRRFEPGMLQGIIGVTSV